MVFQQMKNRNTLINQGDDENNQKEALEGQNKNEKKGVLSNNTKSKLVNPVDMAIAMVEVEEQDADLEESINEESTFKAPINNFSM